MPGFREALLLRIPEKISYLLMRLVDPLRVLALSKHDCKLLHQPPPCNIKRVYDTFGNIEVLLFHRSM